ncbi:MAG: alpha/beta hydrolase family protein [Candidatus Dormibacteria bacterium]
MRRWLARALRLIGAMAALLGVAGVVVFGYAQFESRQPLTLPAPTGVDRVGRAIYDWVDHARMDPYAPDRHTPRELSVWVWYPADPTTGAHIAPYVPVEWEQALAFPGDFAQSRPAAIRSHAYDGAPVASGHFPVLVLAPGLGMDVSSYTTLAEEMASHGYVVAGVNPTYSTKVVLSGGRLVGALPRAADDADLNQLNLVWAADMRFVADHMLALAASNGLFSDRLDARLVGYFGHSAGGAAAAEACRLDPHCAGAADLDGDLAGEVVRTGLMKPFLFIGHDGSLSESSQTLTSLRGLLRGETHGQAHVVTIAGTQHGSFTDRSAEFNLFGQQALEGSRGLRITGVYLGAFFDTAVRGRDGRLLAAPSRAYPEVHFESP